MMVNLYDRVVFIDVGNRRPTNKPTQRVYWVRDLLTGIQLAPLFEGMAFTAYDEALAWISDMKQVEFPGVTLSLRGPVPLERRSHHGGRTEVRPISSKDQTRVVDIFRRMQKESAEAKRTGSVEPRDGIKRWPR